MRAHRLWLDGRGRVLLPPALRSATGLEPGVKLTVVVDAGEVHVHSTDGAAPARMPTLDRKGRLTLPGALRAALNLTGGTVLLLKPDAPGLRLITPTRLIGRLREARVALAAAIAR